MNIKEIIETLMTESKKSPDTHTKVGCIITDNDNNILISGCNDFPKNILVKNERLERPAKYDYIMPAEINVISKSAKFGIKLENSVLYVNRPPCLLCTRSIIEAGIAKFVMIGEQNNIIEKFKDDYEKSLLLLSEAKIKFEEVKIW